MTPRQFLRQVKTIIEAEGSTVLDYQTGHHQKLTIATPRGPRLLVISWSPSDRWVLGNVRKDVRRLLRGV